MAFPVDSVDVEARLRAARVIHERFKRVLDDVMRGRPPKLVIPKRTLSNTIFDPDRGILVLGEEVLERDFLDVGESRRFMQTLLMASIIYQSLVENEYPTIRDLYYRGKHTIAYRDLRGRVREENTWDEQAESDAVIRDVEVYTGMLREDMLILSKEKGKVVGNMRIRSGGDVIDLSRLGHGAYAIESTPDLIEFLDVDAEFVLVVEKDAVFQQLHRIGFWKKYKSLLVTGAGQPDRATRRFVRRLHDELKLPIYILTDSIPGDEVVIIRDSSTGLVHIAPIEELVGNLFTPGVDKERIEAPIEVPSWKPESGRIEWTPIGYIYRHYIEDDLLEIETQGRGVIRVTGGHSLFVFREGKIQVIPAREIQPGDYIIVAERLPGNTIEDLDVNLRAQHGKQVSLNPKIARLLGTLMGGGSINQERYFRASLHPKEEALINLVEEPIKTEFNLHVTKYRNPSGGRQEVQLIAYSKPIATFLKSSRILVKGRDGRIPSWIFNAPRDIKLAFIKGLIDGDGHLDKYGDIVFVTRNEVLAKQFVLLLLMLGINPSIVYNMGDIIIRIGKSPARTPPGIYEYLSGIRGDTAGSIKTEPAYGSPLKSISKTKLCMLLDRGCNPPIDYPILVNSDLTVVKVRRVTTRIYKGYVYDFAVPRTNNFTGNFGIIYHNSDPYGWYIYSVFKVGSIQLSYESERLATPGARFLGVSMTDVFGWHGKRAYLSESERRSFIIRAKDVDVRRAKELMRYSWFRSPRWRRELRLFLERRAKLEIEALASKGLKFLAFQYIPEKIETGDWIS